MSFALIQRGDQKWLSFKHEALGPGYQYLFCLGRHDAQALDIFGFKEIRHTAAGLRVVREGEVSNVSYLSATQHEDDPGQWVITLFPNQVLGSVSADIAMLMMEGPEVEFPAGSTPKEVLATKADGLEVRAAELEAQAEALRAEAAEIRAKHGISLGGPDEGLGMSHTGH